MSNWEMSSFSTWNPGFANKVGVFFAQKFGLTACRPFVLEGKSRCSSPSKGTEKREVTRNHCPLP